MKKILSVILSVCMVLFMGMSTACSNTESSNGKSESNKENSRVIFSDKNAHSIRNYLSASVDIEYGQETMQRVGSENIYTCEAIVTVKIKKYTNQNINCIGLKVQFDLALYASWWCFDDSDRIEENGREVLHIEQLVSTWGEATITKTITGMRSVKSYFDQGNISVLEMKPTVNIFSLEAMNGGIIEIF